MNLLQIEPFLQNISFSVLFLTLLFFWIETSFSWDITKPKSNFLSFGTIGFLIANISLGLLLILRLIKNGYFPLSNLYESLMFLSWSFTIIHLILEKIILISSQTKEKNYFIGVITAPMALFTNAFANFSLPIEMQKATSLVPALQSNWLMMHVTVMMLSYATLLIGCVLSISFLVLTIFKSKFLSNQSFLKSSLAIDKEEVKQSFSEALVNFLKPKENIFIFRKDNIFIPVPTSTSVLNKKEELEIFENYYSTLTQNIDNMSYRILGVGFPLLTIGILSGAVWANEAWGSYWSWDPKETWALITWLIFASYFHVRITKGWKGEKPAILASFGFLIIWICYLGVNLVGKGLHSYGWISF